MGQSLGTPEDESSQLQASLLVFADALARYSFATYTASMLMYWAALNLAFNTSFPLDAIAHRGSAPCSGVASLLAYCASSKPAGTYGQSGRVSLTFADSYVISSKLAMTGAAALDGNRRWLEQWRQSLRDHSMRCNGTAQLDARRPRSAR